MADRGNVHIRRRGTREIVYSMAVSGRVPEQVYEQWMRRLLRQTDAARFFVDDSEIVFPSQADEALATAERPAAAPEAVE